MPTARKQPARSPRRSPKQWRNVVSQFEQSGLTIKGFCQKENLAPATFSKWRSRFREESSEPGFVELQPATPPSPTSGTWSLQIDLPGGGHLRIQVGR